MGESGNDFFVILILIVIVISSGSLGMVPKEKGLRLRLRLRFWFRLCRVRWEVDRSQNPRIQNQGAKEDPWGAPAIRYMLGNM